jgi:acid phosphatase
MKARVLICLITACLAMGYTLQASARRHTRSGPKPYVSVTEPGNLVSFEASNPSPAKLADYIQKLRDYYNEGDIDGGYMLAIKAVDAQADDYLRKHTAGVAKPAIVLDIDETSLSNWAEMSANNFEYFANGPCKLNSTGWPEAGCGALCWELSGKAKAITPTLALFQSARDAGVHVFFVTGRAKGTDSVKAGCGQEVSGAAPVTMQAATEQNLKDAGYVCGDHPNCMDVILSPDQHWAHEADFKSRVREAIEEQGDRYQIILNVGDQESDLAGGHAEKAFKLPNPYYLIP